MSSDQRPTISHIHKETLNLCVCVCCSLGMFYVIALAGAHKRVIEQLRDQLAMVSLHMMMMMMMSELFTVTLVLKPLLSDCFLVISV